jgi:predicted ATPase/class 3 adenylate cyclase
VASGDVPSGTLSFLFTDLADSTLLWEQREQEMADAVTRHDSILTEEVERHGGRVVKSRGDGLMAVFADADAAVRSAVAGLRALRSEDWSVPLGVRMGVCTGPAREAGGDYHGQVVNRAARIADAAHPGQILVAPATAVFLEASAARDLGEFHLKGLPPMRLWQVLAEGLESSFPPLTATAVGLDVAPSTVFVGRANELAAIGWLVSERPFVTLTGVGGAGKTRLALEAARSLAGQFLDGVRFVDLAVVTDPDRVVEAAERALGLVERADIGDRIVRVAEHLRAKAMLCLLDNCEHVIDACGELAAAVLARPGASRVLATSREALGVPGEQVFLVPPLDPRTEGVELFARRASEARSGFDLDATTAEPVALICERLDGIPLAIELAAARVGQLSPVQLLERLSDRFRLLTGGRGRVQRQQTLGATLDWSHELLDEQERVLLRRLAVFPASFTLAGAEAVTAIGDILCLGSLVTKSLVHVVEDGEQFRYRLLETVRLYATEKLVAAGESDELRERHAHWVVDSMASIPLEQRWFGDDTGGVDVDDVRAALGWSSTSGSPTLSSALASGINWSRFDQWREGLRWCEPLADADELDDRSRLQVLAMLLLLHVYDLSYARGGHLDSRAKHALSSAEGIDDPLVSLMWTWRGSLSGALAIETLDHELADLSAEWMETGVAMSEGFTLPWQVYCRLLAVSGLTSLMRGDAAVGHLEAAVPLADQLEGYDTLRAGARGFLSLYRALDGDVDAGLALAKSVVGFANGPIPWREGPLMTVVAFAAAGDVGHARRQLRASLQSLPTDAPLGNEMVVIFGAGIAGAAQNWELTARLLAAGREGIRRSAFAFLVYRTFLARARAALGQARARTLREEGRRLPLQDAVALALGDTAP